MPRPNNLVQTIERVSSLLAIIGRYPEGVSIRQLSSTLGLPKGTVHRLLSSLAYFGYVRQDAATKNYLLGLELLHLGTLVASQLDLRKIAEPLLHGLAERSKETVHMVVWDQGEVVYIEKVESTQGLGGLRMASTLGSRNPGHSCAVGKVFLARMSDDEVDAFIDQRGLVRRTANTITDGTALKDELRLVQAQGYAIDDEENEKGIRCVAAPILDGSGRPVAAVSVSGPAFRVTRKAIQDGLRQQVIETGAEISRRLGSRSRQTEGDDR
jgi:DNA-binding IclR family transcriptional regulator